MKAIAFILVSIFVSMASALVPKYGWGGDVLICQNGENELLEYYQSRLLKNNPPSFGSAHTYAEILEVLLTRLGKHFPEEEQNARAALAVFNKDQQFVQGVDLIGIVDFTAPVRKGCTFKKVVLTRVKQFPEDKQYIIQKDYWNILTPESQAGLVFQMLLFKTSEAHFSDERVDASGYRQLNAELAGMNFQKIKTPQDWNQIIAETKFLSYAYDGIHYLGQRNSFHRNGQFKLALVTKDAVFQHTVFGKTIAVRGYEKGWVGEIEYSASGKIVAFEAVDERGLAFLPIKHEGIRRFYTDEAQTYFGYDTGSHQNLRIGSIRCNFVRTFEFRRDGTLKGASCDGAFPESKDMMLPINFVWVTRNKIIEKVRVDEKFEIKTAQGQVVHCDKDAIVLVNPDGSYRGFETQTNNLNNPQCNF